MNALARGGNVAGPRTPDGSRTPPPDRAVPLAGPWVLVARLATSNQQ